MKKIIKFNRTLVLPAVNISGMFSPKKKHFRIVFCSKFAFLVCPDLLMSMLWDLFSLIKHILPNFCLMKHA